MRRVSGLPVRPCESRALELGCGPGAQLWYLERTGYLAVGCDISAIGLRQAAGRLREEGQPPRLALADCSSLPFALTRST